MLCMIHTTSPTTLAVTRPVPPELLAGAGEAIGGLVASAMSCPNCSTSDVQSMVSQISLLTSHGAGTLEIGTEHVAHVTEMLTTAGGFTEIRPLSARREFAARMYEWVASDLTRPAVVTGSES
jgi:hypothetical protein